MKKLLVLISVLLIASSAAMAAGNLAVGTALGYPTLKYNFTEDFSGQVGAMYASATGATSTALLAKVDYNLAKLGEVQPAIGLYYTSDGAAAATTVIGVTYSVSTMVQSNLSIGVDFTLLSSSSGAVSATGILGAGAVGASTGATVSAALYL